MKTIFTIEGRKKDLIKNMKLFDIKTVGRTVLYKNKKYMISNLSIDCNQGYPVLQKLTLMNLFPPSKIIKSEEDIIKYFGKGNEFYKEQKSEVD